MNLKEWFWEIVLIPWDLWQTFKCKVLDRGHIPFFGICLQCGKSITPGTWLCTGEQFNPEDWAHSLMMDPLTPMVKMGVKEKWRKKRRDANFLYLEAHK